MNNRRCGLLYKDQDIEIIMIMDDQGEVPLNYWYDIKDNESGKVKEYIDIREFSAFTQFSGGKKLSLTQLIFHKTEIIPEIIKLAIKNRELQF